MKTVFLCLAIICINALSFPQTGPALADIVSELETYGPVITTTTFTGAKSRQMILLEQLKQNATNEELLQLVDHEHPIVKIFSFWSMHEPSKPTLTSFFTNEENNQEITIIRGCFVEKTSLFSILTNDSQLVPKQNELPRVITSEYARTKNE